MNLNFSICGADELRTYSDLISSGRETKRRALGVCLCQRTDHSPCCAPIGGAKPRKPETVLDCYLYARRLTS
jgi:hypothetical protein